MFSRIYEFYRGQPRGISAGLLLGLIGAVGILGSMPGPTKSIPSVEGLDKVMHSVAFGAATVFLWFASKKPRWWIIASLISMLGALDEYHQSFLSFRSCDFYDWLTDSLAALVVALWLWKVQRKAAASPLGLKGTDALGKT